MKKILFTLVLLITTVSLAQKAKTPIATTSNALATFENLKAEIITEGGKQKLAILLDNNGKNENNGNTGNNGNNPLLFTTSSLLTDMNNMFKDARAFNQELTHFTNTSNVTDMSNMFNGASIFNKPISFTNTSNVTNMIGMFQGASAFNQEINSWNVKKVRKFENIFSGDFDINIKTKKVKI